jgi:ferredoxin
VPADQLAFIKLNVELARAEGWKSITKRKPALPDADDWKDVKSKIGMLVR